MSDQRHQSIGTTIRLRRIPRTSLTLLVLEMAGCASGPDYRAPVTPKAAAGPFVSRPVDTNSAASLPAVWWKLYDDPVLDSLIQEAFSANTNLREAMANLDRARAIYQEARGSLDPSTNLSAGTGYGRDQTTWTGTGQAPSNGVTAADSTSPTSSTCSAASNVTPRPRETIPMRLLRPMTPLG
ncbi:TPA: TolC family protein [Raoultella ornithinolytica]